MTRQLQNEFIAADLPDGRRAMFVLPVIPEDAPADIREGLARRRLAALTGQCPCGAEDPSLSRQQRRARARQRAKATTTALRAVFEHEYGCLAQDAVLIPLLRCWADADQDRT